MLPSFIPFDIIPFVISIFIELVSPIVGVALKKRTDVKIDQDYGGNPTEGTNLKTKFGKLNAFILDGSSTILGLIVTIATAITIPFLRARPDVGYVLVLVLLSYAFLAMLYFAIVDPERHQARSLGPLSFFAVITIATNLFFIYLFAFSGTIP